jgi:hypothetical protein
MKVMGPRMKVMGLHLFLSGIRKIGFFADVSDEDEDFRGFIIR